MITISVHEMFGNACMTQHDGELLFETISSKLASGETVTLDFAGVRFYLGSFFNVAVGKLVSSFTPSELYDRLLFANIPDHARKTIEAVVDNAERYFNDPSLRASLEADIVSPEDER